MRKMQTCIIGALAIISVILLALILKTYSYEPNRSKHTWTFSHLSRVENAIGLYSNEYQRQLSLNAWREELEPFVELTGAKEGTHWSHDAWGMEIQYVFQQIGDKKVPVLYSLGRNKIDEKGQGDDIVVEVEMPVSESEANAVNF